MLLNFINFVDMVGAITALIACVLFGFLGQYVAKQKNRSGGEGFLLGFFLTLVGVFIILLLPTKEKVKQEYTQEQIEKRKELAKQGDNQFKKLLLWTIVIFAIVITISFIIN